ncbi:unnamed protein product [Acanthosepion pharaonis]|uniref:Uncharacterized protein n=1 Tax=Acanthosepion pharaonis TaxID=158019 RepID=A0A812CSK9_ACAPH|nr:unnamed protein product [Sepia pharaonis]
MWHYSSTVPFYNKICPRIFFPFFQHNSFRPLLFCVLYSFPFIFAFFLSIYLTNYLSIYLSISIRNILGSSLHYFLLFFFFLLLLLLLLLLSFISSFSPFHRLLDYLRLLFLFFLYFSPLSILFSSFLPLPFHMILLLLLLPLLLLLLLLPDPPFFFFFYFFSLLYIFFPPFQTDFFLSPLVVSSVFIDLFKPSISFFLLLIILFHFLPHLFYFLSFSLFSNQSINLHSESSHSQS